jgi:hypothetical protein
LAGAKCLLEQCPKPQWMVEICVAEHQPSGVAVNPRLFSTFEKFWEAGYEAWTASGQPRRVAASEVRSVAQGGPNTFRSYNFLFLEKGRTPPSFAEVTVAKPAPFDSQLVH